MKRRTLDIENAIMLAVAMNSAKVTTTELRRDFRTILDRLLRGEHVEVSNYTRTCAVVVDPEWYALASAAMTHAGIKHFVIADQDLIK